MFQGACEDNTLSLPLRQSLLQVIVSEFNCVHAPWEGLLLMCAVCLLRAHAKEVAMAFINRTDLHATICTALYRLCTQNRDVLKVGHLFLSPHVRNPVT